MTNNGMCFLMQQSAVLTLQLRAPHFLLCRTIYRSDLSPRWTRRGGQYTLLPNFGSDKSGLQFGREGQWAIREGRFKYVNDGGSSYLYDVVADPREESPIQNAITTDRLRGKLNFWWRSMLIYSGSFTTPVFYIGYPGSSSGLILPSAAAERNGGWTLGEHYVSGRVDAGNYLKYNVIVASAGGYNIKVCQG